MWKDDVEHQSPLFAIHTLNKQPLLLLLSCDFFEWFCVSNPHITYPISFNEACEVSTYYWSSRNSFLRVCYFDAFPPMNKTKLNSKINEKWEHTGEKGARPTHGDGLETKTEKRDKRDGRPEKGSTEGGFTSSFLSNHISITLVVVLWCLITLLLIIHWLRHHWALQLLFEAKNSFQRVSQSPKTTSTGAPAVK